MPDLIKVVSRRTGKKLEIPRKRYDRHPDLFKLPPSAKKKATEAKAAPAVTTETNPKPKPTAPVDDKKEAADGAQT